MKAELIVHDRVKARKGGIVEIKVWAIPLTPDQQEPTVGADAGLTPKPHGFKYSLVYIKDGSRIIGYDNAEGKGDHRHYYGTETQYKFIGIEKLFKDFYRDLKEVLEDEG